MTTDFVALFSNQLLMEEVGLLSTVVVCCTECAKNTFGESSFRAILALEYQCNYTVQMTLPSNKADPTKAALGISLRGSSVDWDVEAMDWR